LGSTRKFIENYSLFTFIANQILGSFLRQQKKSSSSPRTVGVLVFHPANNKIRRKRKGRRQKKGGNRKRRETQLIPLWQEKVVGFQCWCHGGILSFLMRGEKKLHGQKAILFCLVLKAASSTNNRTKE
jgi:hypothetical protein